MRIAQARLPLAQLPQSSHGERDAAGAEAGSDRPAAPMASGVTSRVYRPITGSAVHVGTAGDSAQEPIGGVGGMCTVQGRFFCRRALRCAFGL